jgi:cell division protein FtsB
MARYLVVFSLVILCCATNSFAAVTTDKWLELEMKLDEKINKVEARNVQLEEKVHQLENQQLLNVSLPFIFKFLL